jgi:hypothetical protein
MEPERAALHVQACWRGWRCRRRLAACREHFAARCAALEPEAAVSWLWPGPCLPRFQAPEEPALDGCQTEQLTEAETRPASIAERRSRLLSELAWSQAALAGRLLELRSRHKTPEV